MSNNIDELIYNINQEEIISKLDKSENIEKCWNINITLK